MFFFRIYSEDGSGIVYLAKEKQGDAYMCAGARQIGVHKKKCVWHIADYGGYKDLMPECAMYDRQDIRPYKNQNEIPKPNNTATLYSDGKSYWFVDTTLTQ